MENQSKATKRIKKIIFFWGKLKTLRQRLNQRMEGKYSPTLIALCVTFIIALISSICLFLPNYLGVADDGSVTKIMDAVGVYYIQDEPEDIYNNYFIRTYSRVKITGTNVNSPLSSHVLLVKAAVFFDDIVTGDKVFDIRFLALTYMILYIPAVYILIHQACDRVRKFSEGVVISIIGMIIFSDVAYITYFNSFYPEAVWFISLIYCVGFMMRFQNVKNGYWDFWNLIFFLTAGTVLITSRKQCALIGIFLAAYCIKLIFIRNHWIWGVTCVLSAVLLCFFTSFSLARLSSDFDTTSKLHAMTRGVLFSSDNPTSALAEFGIDSSYEMLTDASAYDYLPFVNATDPSLEEGFLNKYDIPDIAVYYIRHPGKLLRMIDLSIKSCFDVRRSYCGNYEKSVGMPPRAKSIFWTAWSMFKSTSAPKTIGFLILLMAGVFMLFWKKYTLRPVEDRRNTVFLDALVVTFLIILSQSVITIINSGDAEMTQHCFIVCLGMDIITYYVFSEIVHKLNIL